MMLSHVNEFSGCLYSLERSLYDIFRTSDECNHRTVGGFARIHVQNLYSSCLLDRSDYGVYDFHIASFAEIRHALDNSFHICYDVLLILIQPIKLRLFRE